MNNIIISSLNFFLVFVTSTPKSVLLVFGLLMSEAFAARYMDLTQTNAVLERDLNKTDEGSLWDSLGIRGQTALKFKDVLVTAQGNKIKKFQETFRGIPVYKTLVDVEYFQNGGSHVLVGNVYDGLEDDLDWQMKCTLCDEDALQIALDYANIRGATVVDSQTSEVIFIADNQTAFNTLQLDMSVSVGGGGGSRNHSQLLTFIAICNGGVLKQDQMPGQIELDRNYADAPTEAGDDDNGGGKVKRALPEPPKNIKPTVDCSIKQKAGNPKRTFYFGTKPHCLELKRVGNICYLENDWIRGVDLKQTIYEGRTRIVRFPCTKGYKDGINGGFAPTLEAFYFATKTIKAYQDWYDYTPMRTPTYVKAHYKKDFANAYFFRGYLLFGDGDPKKNYPYTNADTVAHEFGHAILRYGSGLINRDQSGGIHEAYNDMLGEVVEEYVFGKCDMLSGAELFIAPNMALRWFEDPTKDTYSIKHIDWYRPKMLTHDSSGVYNHVFYQMVKAFGTCRVAFEPFMIANRFHWEPDTNFENAACGVIQGAYKAGLDMGLVVNSLKKVGITLKHCKPLHQYVTTQLTPSKTQTGLHISKVRNPLFKVETKGVSKSTIVVTVSRGCNATVSRSHTRSSGDVIAVGSSKVRASIPRNVNTLYIRVFPELGDQEIREGNIRINFE